MHFCFSGDAPEPTLPSPSPTWRAVGPGTWHGPFLHRLPAETQSPGGRLRGNGLTRLAVSFAEAKVSTKPGSVFWNLVVVTLNFFFFFGHLYNGMCHSTLLWLKPAQGSPAYLNGISQDPGRPRRNRGTKHREEGLRGGLCEPSRVS